MSYTKFPSVCCKELLRGAPFLQIFTIRVGA